MNQYTYNRKTFHIELNDDNKVQIMRDGEYNFIAFVSAKNAGGHYYVTGPHNNQELADSPEEALDKACEIILNEIKIAKQEKDAENRLIQYYNAQEF